MKININSWHYRLNNKIFGTVPNYLCPYLRLLVFSAMFGWMKILSRYLRKYNISFPNFGLIRWISRQRILENKNFLLTMYGTGIIGLYIWGKLDLGFVIGASIGIGLISTSRYTLHPLIRWLENTRLGKYIEEHDNTETKTPNIFNEAIKANHDKICPHLEFVDKNIEQFNEKVDVIKTEKLTEQNLLPIAGIVKQEDIEELSELNKTKKKINQ